MFHRFHVRLSLAAAVLALLFTSLAGAQDNSNGKHARKYKVPPPAARIEVTVLRATNGKPIEDAHVIFHPIQGDQDQGSLEVKTNEDGKTIIDVIPIGDTVRMQIIAAGFQTYGEDYKIDRAEITKEIRMNRPGQQYSIYKDKPADNGQGSGGDKGPNPPKDAPSPNTKAPDSGNQQNSNPPAK